MHSCSMSTAMLSMSLEQNHWAAWGCVKTCLAGRQARQVFTQPLNLIFLLFRNNKPPTGASGSQIETMLE
jgi:hypothetical protein